MHSSDRLYLSKFSVNADYDSFFENDNIEDFDNDADINQLLDAVDLGETDDYFWDEN